MKKDLPAVIRKVSEFLKKTLTESDVSSLAEHLSFTNMKMNKSVNNEDMVAASKKRLGHTEEPGQFMRKGETGEITSARGSLPGWWSGSSEHLEGLT